MIFENYGMRFIRLAKEHLELVRYWRNHETITPYMENNTPITYEAQLEWFKKVNTNENLFFIAEYDNQCIGLISGKGFNEKKSIGEGGIFIWEQKWLNSFIPVKLSMALIEFSFIYCNFEQAFAKILNTNKRAIQFNKMLGYKLLPKQEGVLNQKYLLRPEEYLKKRKFLKSIIEDIKQQPTLIFSKEDVQSGYSKYFIENFLRKKPIENFPELIIKRMKNA